MNKQVLVEQTIPWDYQIDMRYEASSSRHVYRRIIKYKIISQH